MFVARILKIPVARAMQLRRLIVGNAVQAPFSVLRSRQIPFETFKLEGLPQLTVIGKQPWNKEFSAPLCVCFLFI